MNLRSRIKTSFGTLTVALLIGVNLTVLTVLCATTVNTYGRLIEEMNEVLDAQLAQTARTIAGIQDQLAVKKHNVPIMIPSPQFEPKGREYSAELTGIMQGGPYESQISFQVWDEQGRLLMGSENATRLPISEPISGYHDRQVDGIYWIGFSLQDERSGHWIYTAQQQAVREHLSQYIAQAQIEPLLWAMIPISLFTVVLVLWLMRPIRSLAQALEGRDVDNLTPIVIELPSELQPVLTSINRHFERLRHYLVREKQFIHDASHELRTPVTVIKLHADCALRTTDTTELQHTLQSISTGASRLTHLVNQLLLVAKLDQSAKIIQRPLSYQYLLEESFLLMAPAFIKRVQWQIHCTDAQCCIGDETLLIILLRNLLDNAAKYALPGSTVDVRFTFHEDDYSIEVENSGQQLSAQELCQLTERFYRPLASLQIDGAGLGLAIVSRIVQRHQGQLSLESPKNGGLRVLIQWAMKTPPVQPA